MPRIDHVEARKIAERSAHPLWNDEFGTMTTGEVLEDSKEFLIPIIAKESLTSDDIKWQPMDPDYILVEKKTGRVTKTTPMLIWDKIDRMKPVNVE
jgi:hypothetical protein